MSASSAGSASTGKVARRIDQHAQRAFSVEHQAGLYLHCLTISARQHHRTVAAQHLPQRPLIEGDRKGERAGHSVTAAPRTRNARQYLPLLSPQDGCEAPGAHRPGLATAIEPIGTAPFKARSSPAVKPASVPSDISRTMSAIKQLCLFAGALMPASIS